MVDDTAQDDTIKDRAQAIVDEFALFPDWMGKYEYLIEMGKSIPQIDAAYKNDAHRIHGCQSKVWVRAESENGHVRYTGDSNAMITKGLAALVIRVLDDQPSDAIADADFDFMEEIGMDEHLSSTRKNGLAAMIKQMKRFAREAAGEEEKEST
jgi:cysteine desulfuration protein SufE